MKIVGNLLTFAIFLLYFDADHFIIFPKLFDIYPKTLCFEGSRSHQESTCNSSTLIVPSQDSVSPCFLFSEIEQLPVFSVFSESGGLSWAGRHASRPFPMLTTGRGSSQNKRNVG